MQNRLLAAAIASTLTSAATRPAASVELGPAPGTPVAPSARVPYDVGSAELNDANRGEPTPVLGADLTEPLSDEALEAKIEAAKPTAPRITKEHIQSLIVDETYTLLEGTRTTVCRLQLANGFCVVGVNNGPVSAANFSQEIGCEYAYKAAVDQIWPLEGYLLAERLFAGDVHLEKVGKLRDHLQAVQTAPDGDVQGDYMRGVVNGLRLALSVFTGQEPEFVTGPATPEGATHVAKPVHVTARRIAQVNAVPGPAGANCAELVFADGSSYTAGVAQCAQHWPLVGDAMIFLSPDDHYICPADVFERKYSALS